MAQPGQDDAASTRAFTIGNTDNRLMCGAARIRWDDIFKEWVSHNQKGFLRGRSMLSNVLTVDHEAMRVSLQCNAGAIILFDFKAAFPSIEREFMLKSLRWLGVPERQVRFIVTMYHQTKVKIRAAGGEGEWFEMTRGIRQGCPLSSLFFAVVVISYCEGSRTFSVTSGSRVPSRMTPRQCWRICSLLSQGWPLSLTNMRQLPVFS